MQNFYDIVKNSLYFNKFIIDDLVCVEYTCPLEEEQMGIFTQHDYVLHVLSGEKTWRTIDGKHTLKGGETLFVKKGASVITQNFAEDFCMLAFFLPDTIIRYGFNDVNCTVSPILYAQSPALVDNINT